MIAASMAAGSEASTYPLGLGIETTPDGEVIGTDGEKVPGLLALGPIARGAFWEMTAVPELRGLCAAVGRRLAAG